MLVRNGKPRKERIPMTERTFRQPPPDPSELPEKRNGRTRGGHERHQREEQEGLPKRKLNVGAFWQRFRGGKGSSPSGTREGSLSSISPSGRNEQREKESKAPAEPVSTTLGRHRRINGRSGRLNGQETEETHRQDTPNARSKPHTGAETATLKALRKQHREGHDSTNASPIRDTEAERPSFRKRLTTNLFARTNRNPEHHKQKVTQSTEPPAAIAPPKVDSHGRKPLGRAFSIRKFGSRFNENI